MVGWPDRGRSIWHIPPPHVPAYCILVAGQAAYGIVRQSVLRGVMGGFIAMGIQSAQPSSMVPM